MTVGRLADEDAFGVAPTQIDDGVADQSVIDHHIGALHESQRTKSQQVGVARARANQIDLAFGGTLDIGRAQCALNSFERVGATSGKQ